MPNNRELAVAFGILSVAWNLLGFTGYYAKAGLTASGLGLVSVTTILVLIFTIAIAVMPKSRWITLGAVIAGVIYVISAILGLTATPMRLIYGPAVAIVLGAIFTYFSFKVYRQ